MRNARGSDAAYEYEYCCRIWIQIRTRTQYTDIIWIRIRMRKRTLALDTQYGHWYGCGHNTRHTDVGTENGIRTWARTSMRIYKTYTDICMCT